MLAKITIHIMERYGFMEVINYEKSNWILRDCW